MVYSNFLSTVENHIAINRSARVRNKKTRGQKKSDTMFERVFAWCGGLSRPGKADDSAHSDTDQTLRDTNHASERDQVNNDTSSDLGSEVSSMISVEEIDPITGKPQRVLKKKKSLIGRAYRKMTKSRSTAKNSSSSVTATVDVGAGAS